MSDGEIGNSWGTIYHVKTFEKREDPIVLMKRRLLILVLLIVTLLLVRGVYGVAVKESESRALRVEVESELTELAAREAEIRTDIANLASERGIEKALRSEYELAREGESVIVIVGDDQEPDDAPRLRSTAPWWAFWR